MRDEELERLEGLAAKASIAPWVCEQSWCEEFSTHWRVSNNECDIIVGSLPPVESDAQFIAAARDSVPALVAEVRRLRKANDSAFQSGFDAGASNLSRALKEAGKL